MTDMTGYRAIQTKIANDECVILDGGIATELRRQGLRQFKLSDHDHWGFEALHEAPHLVSSVHREYLKAGCDVVTTNTYGILDAPAAGADSAYLPNGPVHWMDLARKSVTLAREAIAAEDAQSRAAVALSIGGDIFTAEQLETIRLLIRALDETSPDFVVFETLSMMTENRTRQAIQMLMDAGLPVWLSFRRSRHGVCGIYGQLWGGPEGDYFGRLARGMEQLGVGALLINCLPVDMVSGTLPWLRDFTDLPLGAYPNLGRYLDPDWHFDEQVGPDDFARMALNWRAEGAQILGGCCGVGPDEITAMSTALVGTSAGSAVSKAVENQAGPLRVERRYEAEPVVDVEPWRDDHGRSVFPLPLPEIAVDQDVFVPTQGSYLIWKFLFNEHIGADKRCLDVGCGVGLLAVQLALNGAREVTAIDIQKEAVGNTMTNAFRNGVADRLNGQVVDLYAFEPGHRYDVVVASLYQMPTDPVENFSGHRPIDYWGRNLLDYFIIGLPRYLRDDGVAYFMQISLISQVQTAQMLKKAGYESRVLDFNLYNFNSVFLENLKQIQRVEEASDAYHFTFGNEHVMGMYLVEARRIRDDPDL